jgi:hypothetical protein
MFSLHFGRSPRLAKCPTVDPHDIGVHNVFHRITTSLVIALSDTRFTKTSRDAKPDAQELRSHNCV